MAAIRLTLIRGNHSSYSGVTNYGQVSEFPSSLNKYVGTELTRQETQHMQRQSQLNNRHPHTGTPKGSPSWMYICRHACVSISQNPSQPWHNCSLTHALVQTPTINPLCLTSLPHPMGSRWATGRNTHTPFRLVSLRTLCTPPPNDCQRYVKRLCQLKQQQPLSGT